MAGIYFFVDQNIFIVSVGRDWQRNVPMVVVKSKRFDTDLVD
jgi:hypothetical protein